jgi:ATP-dependent exoDNAse (exonuclease V) beta subunit
MAMETQDSVARKRIRESLDESLIVEAAAGTGKTTELIQRILAVLRSGRTTVDKIVAVTFTRKAAGELRLRLRVELDKARQDAKDAQQIRFLEDALARLEEAHLGTIHSFCAEILRQRPVEAQLAPGFEEIDETQALRLYSRAFDSWIQDRLQEMSPALRRTISRFSIERATEETRPIERLRQAGLEVVGWRDFRQSWSCKTFNRDEEARQLISEIAVLAEITSECNVPKHPLRQHLQPAVDFMARLKRSEEIGRHDMDELEALLIRLSGQLNKRPKAKGAPKFSPSHSRDEVLERMHRLAAELAEFAQRADADLAALLQAEMQELIDIYEDMKARSGKVDFVDLLVRTRNVIRDDQSVRKLLHERFSHIFVDEFQDTDPVQAELLVLLSGNDPNETNWRKVTPKPGKLFLVGDPKQSIYRFRRADIILYQDVCANLNAKGIDTVYLSHSFRAVKPIQEAVNAAFAPKIQRNESTGQPAYVALEGGVAETEQPAVIALPIPHPYGTRGITKGAIDQCLPETIASFVDWLVGKSGWKVRDPGGSAALIPIESQHVAILFKRFMSWGADVTRGYVHALEARNIPHQLWQARSFHQREEVENILAALNSIEWPDDELSVFATLKGNLFAIPDSVLLRFRYEFGTFRPFRRLPENLHSDFHPIRDALTAIADLHRRRNRRAVVETVNTVLEMARAHAAFALRPSGNQVLANVYHICNLARAYELGGGYSFRGFVDQLNEQAETEDSAEAPIVEEGSEGVRIMTVHAAKGLEFPVVILADITANSSPREPGRHIDAEQNLCAVRVANCAPWELIDHMAEEHDRDLAEGVRVAYVAATRARDLLVVPAVGDQPFENGWIASLNKALYPAQSKYREAHTASSCPAFGDTSVLSRPMEYDGSLDASVKPGIHVPDGCNHSVVWWDPALFDLRVEGSFGLRQEGILSDGSQAAPGRTQYQSWKSNHQQAVDQGQVPGLSVFIATEGFEPPSGYADRVKIERIEREGTRPKGPRFGSLVHLILKDVDFGAAPEAILQLARTHARLLNATPEEVEAAAQALIAALRYPLLKRARQAARCHRELPILIKHDLGVLDAVIDLAFLEEKTWTVVDFKTDEEDPQRVTKYRRQVGWYIYSIEKATGASSAGGYLLHL